jgi:enoyl-CoA hydratase
MADFYGFTYFTTELREEGILWVAFNRPERRNAITPEMHAEIAPLFRECRRVDGGGGQCLLCG